MTTQEFVKKEAELAANQMFPMGNEHETKMIARQEYKNGFIHGSAQWIQIAESFAEWLSELRNANAVMRIIDKRPASELLTIFLTENTGNDTKIKQTLNDYDTATKES